MLISFLLFCFIGYIPFVAAFFGLKIDWEIKKNMTSSIIVTYLLYAFLQLFLITIILPEIQGHVISSFIISLVISSFEIIGIWFIIIRKKNTKPTRLKYVAFIWGTLNGILCSILQFISNSRTYELELNQIVFSFGTISYLLQAFAGCYICSSLNRNVPIWGLPYSKQLLALAYGIPQSCSVLSGLKSIPSYVPDILRIVTSFVLFLLTRPINQSH